MAAAAAAHALLIQLKLQLRVAASTRKGGYATGTTAEKTAVLIDLGQYGELWEDFYDTIVALDRADEPRESLESVRETLKQQGKLDV